MLYSFFAYFIYGIIYGMFLCTNKEFNSTCLVSFPSVRAARVCAPTSSSLLGTAGKIRLKLDKKRKVTNGCVLEGRKMRNIGAVAFRSRRKYER